MPAYPIVVREIGGTKRLGVEDAENLDVNLREVVEAGYERVDVATCEDGEQVGTVFASGVGVEDVQWED